METDVTIVERVGKLEQWQARLEQNWRVLMAVIAIVVPTAGFTVVSAYQEFNKKVDAARGQIDQRIKDSLDSGALRDKALTFTREAVVRRVQEDIDSNAVGELGTLLSNVKVTLQLRKDRSAEAGHTGAQVQDTTTLMYQLNALFESQMSPENRSALTPDRREALALLMSGVLERVRDKKDYADDLFRLAHRRDPSLPEPLLYLASNNLSRVGYVGSGNWTLDSYRKETIRYLNEAVSIPGAKQSHEVQLMLCWLPYLNNQPELAVNQIDALIASDTKSGRKLDPRLYANRGFLNWLIYAKQPRNDSLRLESARDNYRAFELDSEFIDALNGYVWNITHRSENDDLVTPGDESESNRIKQSLSLLASDPSIRHSANMLNTVGEAYAALGMKKEAHAFLCAAVAEAPFHEYSRTSQKLYSDQLNRYFPKELFLVPSGWPIVR